MQDKAAIQTGQASLALVTPDLNNLCYSEGAKPRTEYI